MKALVIKSSLFAEQSVSNQVVDAIVAKRGYDAVHTLDVTKNPLPYLTLDLLAQNPTSDQLIADLFETDVLIVAAPLYNFSIPAQLKTYFDYISKAGKTFKYSEQGVPQGLVTGKKAIVVVSSGGAYANTAIEHLEQASTYIKTILGFIGVTDVEVIRAEGAAYNKQQAIEIAISKA